MRWVLARPDPEGAAYLSRELGVSSVIASLLAARGITDAKSAERFLNPCLAHLHDPLLMLDMGQAVSLLRRAIEAQDKILIYGDYDVDGALAVVLLLAALRSLGARVETYIPNRLTDGYGMTVPGIERAAAAGARVIVSVDTGVRDYEALARAQALGIDVVVTDHHLPGERLPVARAILNPRRQGCGYPEKNLAGVGVALKLAQALLGPKLNDATLRSYLKVAAIGSIADAVPLTGENRVIAHAGLRGISAAAAGIDASPRSGIEALLAVAGLTGKPVTAADIAFRIAPRLNAAGRMEDARKVIELFERRPAEEIQTIAAALDDLNHRRQQVQDEIVRQVEERTRQAPDAASRYTLVFAGDGWHRGVIGIVAQRLVDLFHRPALVMSVDGQTAHGSGRSIRGFHLLDALTACGALLDRFGGHAQAAGFSLQASRIQELEQEFERYAHSTLAPEDLTPMLRIDGAVNLSDVSRELCAELRRLEPFGCGNAAPVFMAEARIAGEPRILKEKHLKLSVFAGAKRLDAIGWGMADRASSLAGARRAMLAFSLSENTFQGITSLQLVLRDVRPA